MWLKVIREELLILDQLAAGMIDDIGITREEVELAITRAKIVVNEFEVLYRQLAETPVLAGVMPEQTESLPETTVVNETPENLPEPIDLKTAVSPVPAEEEVPAVIEPVESSAQVDSTPAMEEPSKENVSEDAPVSEIPTLNDTIYNKVEVNSGLKEESPGAADSNIMNIEEHQEYQPQFKALPLKSLKEGLSLNDRYLFQRELFDNDKARLDEALANLDSLENIQEAVVYLKANFKWIRSEASEKFVHLVKRRFS